MAKAKVEAGICGFVASIEATAGGRQITLRIISDCPRVQKMAETLTEVDGLAVIGPRSRPNPIKEAAAEARLHAACVVPTAIIKAIEVSAGLALPRDVHIQIEA
jgi:hypothetical protein